MDSKRFTTRFWKTTILETEREVDRAFDDRSEAEQYVMDKLRSADTKGLGKEVRLHASIYDWAEEREFCHLIVKGSAERGGASYEQQAGRMKQTAVPEADEFAQVAIHPRRRVTKAMDEAVYQAKRLREDEWAGWAIYLLELLDDAYPDDEFLVTVRGSINARLEEGSW